MVDRLSKEQRSKNMSAVGSEDTDLELKVRKALYNRGLRYRKHYDVLGKPDIAFVGKKIAIFINGCFWHHHDCDKGVIPQSNNEFWKKKLQKNKMRDGEVKKELNDLGWKVIEFWECEIKDENAFQNKINQITEMCK